MTSPDHPALRRGKSRLAEYAAALQLGQSAAAASEGPVKIWYDELSAYQNLDALLIACLGTEQERAGRTYRFIED